MAVHPARAGMAEDHRGLCHIQRIEHRVLAHMAEIHQHADTLHFAHHILAEIGQPAMLGLVRSAVRPFERLGMRQREIARAEVIHLAQHAQAAIDGTAALHPHQRGDLALLQGRFDIGGTGRQHHVIGIARHQTLEHVDLLQREHDSLGLRQVRIDIDRPELRPDLALAQTRQIGVHAHAAPIGRRGLAGIGKVELVDYIAIAAAQLLGHVIMAIPHRRGGERGGCGFLRALRSQRCCQGSGAKGGDEQSGAETGHGNSCCRAA